MIRLDFGWLAAPWQLRIGAGRRQHRFRRRDPCARYRSTLTSAALALLVLGQVAAQAPAAYRVPAAAPANIKRAVEVAGPPRRATRTRRRSQAGRDADARRDRRRRARRRARGVRPLLDEHARRGRRRVGPGLHGRHAVDGPLRRRSRARVRHRARERDVHAGELQPDAAADERRRRAHGAVLSRPHARQRRHGGHEQEDSRGAEAGRHLSRHRSQRRGTARAGATRRRCIASTRRRSRAR